MTPLSNRQKSALSQLARRAYDHAGSGAAEPLPDFGTWRREEVRKACGKYGLTECTQREYLLVKAAFNSLLGEDGEAFENLVRAGTEWRRQAETVLLDALDGAGLPQSYAETISQSRFKCSVTDCSDDQFRAVLITVKSRAKAKRKKLEAVAT